jgi:hypothetical protein
VRQDTIIPFGDQPYWVVVEVDDDDGESVHVLPWDEANRCYARGHTADTLCHCRPDPIAGEALGSYFFNHHELGWPGSSDLAN